MTISSGDSTVIENGSIVCRSSVPLYFIFEEVSPPPQFRFIINVVDDIKCASKTELRKASGGILQITFLNFPAGAVDNANPEPLCLGNINGKTLFLSYRIDSLGGAEPYIFHYTWYLEEATDED
ncbi:MAG: hypothetical protein A2020_13985 [Lentisphaerae bacterium GWF2_45_14]|nr:MAG: hypothetical protein A2020_13985 [Lentisphaerae bacterium GWF2_45_14]